MSDGAFVYQIQLLVAAAFAAYGLGKRRTITKDDK